MLRSFPLMVLPLLLFLLFAYLLGWSMDRVLFEAGLPSGVRWQMELGQGLAALGLVLLFFEILKSTRTSLASVFDHVRSIVVMIVYLILFLLVPKAGNGAFFLLMVMSFVDVIAGYSVSMTAARRDISIGQQ